jgi:GAF domain
MSRIGHLVTTAKMAWIAKNLRKLEPSTLESASMLGRPWTYPWLGLLIGAGAGALVGHPIAMDIQNLHDAHYHLASFHPEQIFLDSFLPHLLIMKLLYTILGGILGAMLGATYRFIEEDRLRLGAAHRELKRQARYLNTYMTVSSLVSQCLDPRELMEAVLNVIMEVVSAEAASVLLLDEDRANFQFYSIEGPAKQCLMGVTFPADRGIAGSILQAQRSEVINDAQRDPRFFKRVDSESGFVTKNLIAIPLTAGEEKIGVMQVLNKSRSGLFTDEERLLLDSLAEEIAFAIRNAKLFELVVKSYCKIRQGEHSCRGCKRPLGSWTPCVKYREELSLF